MKTKNLLLLFFAALTISATFFAGCKKEDDDNNNNTATCSDGIKNQNETDVDCGGVCAACTPPAITINSPEQVYFKLDGIPYHFVIGQAEYQELWGASRNNGVDSSFAESYSSAISDQENSKGVGVGIGSLWYTGGVLPSSAEFESLFQVGNYSYTEDALWGASVDILIGKSSEYFATYQGTMLQDSNSRFRITHVQPYTQLGTRNVKVRIEFSCKVYSSVDGSVKTITDGVYVASFSNI